MARRARGGRAILETAARQTTDVFGVATVFGKPYRSHGMTVITAARVVGNGGGGGGFGNEAQKEGEGFGFGLNVSARPAGAYVLRANEVRWVPSIDVNRIVTFAGVAFLATVWLRRAQLKALSKTAKSPPPELQGPATHPSDTSQQAALAPGR